MATTVVRGVTLTENTCVDVHETHVKDVMEAQEIKKSIRGVKGWAIVLKLPHFNAIWGFPYDFMHGTLLGVQKQIGESCTIQGSPIYLNKTQRTEVNNRLTSITPIKEIQRLPRPLNIRCSLFILLQNNITDKELQKCEIDLLRFVADFEILYGKENVTFNIHALLHIVESVRMCGPLWATSTFSFESTNFHLKQQLSEPKGVDSQISKKYLQKNLWKCFSDEKSTTDYDEAEMADNVENEDLHDRNNDDDSIMFEASALTVSDVMEMITGLCLRYNLSYEVRKAIVDLAKCLAGPRHNNGQFSKYNIQQKYDSPENIFTYTFYCTLCKARLLGPICKTEFKNQPSTCRKCNEKYLLSMQSENKFIYVDLKYQLIELLSNTYIQQHVIDYICGRNDRKNEGCNGTIGDVSDSKVYRNLISKYSYEANDEYLLTYNFNTDGMPIFNSSKKSSWPILLYINELQPSMQFKHVLMCALWVGDKEPTPEMMNTFLEQFVKEAIQLFEEGIVINNRQKRIIFKFAPMFCVVDSVARPVVQNRLQYNGYNGCSWCYANGKYLRGCVRYLFCDTNCDLSRSHETHVKDVMEAQEIKKSVRGVKGWAIVLKLPHFNAIWGFPYDFMHELTVFTRHAHALIYVVGSHYKRRGYYMGS
ncbi:PREDICTED: uncharacterized protein LOC105448390 [Wasmannia auropunctata]|uniref:uncharacterized protein LOC105448390 n=1 Tax=Wasmannia auropunctata TaxID=64793 RepID=UPI0005F0B37D|nr:PREDICTED: uncharacterized protein LOC105448390 [Wasmannia auropunctata]